MLNFFKHLFGKKKKQLEAVEQESKQQEKKSKIDEILDKLEKIEKKLDEITKKEDVLPILNDIYWILKKDRQMKKLTEKDIKLLEVLYREGPMTAEDVASFLGISRSTSSLRLNRLYSIGYLEKRIMDRKVYFVIKNEEEIEKLLEEFSS